MFGAELYTNTTSTALLGVAALLAMWLLLRVRRHEETRRRIRRAPTTMEELGHMVFEVARGADIDGYRDLFLAGAEAASVMGDDADAYLERRNAKTLEESLINLGALIPVGSFYGGVEQTGPERWGIRANPRVGPKVLIDFGTVVRVGAVFRLREPSHGNPA